jgi:hypothetical protein
MPAKKKSTTGAKKTTAAKKPSAAKRSAVKTSSPPKQAAKTQEPETSAESAVQKTEDRLSGVARTIGSTVGDLVAKTKKVLKR